MFKKILIANRGEIALRVVRACKDLGITACVAYSTADRNTAAVEEADERVCIGPAPSAQSYLDMARLVGAAVSRGCEAVHPGYGFLSENAAVCPQVHGVRPYVHRPRPGRHRPHG